MRPGVIECAFQGVCGCVSVNPHDCLEERHRRWPRESADYFDGDACRCACHASMKTTEPTVGDAPRAKPSLTLWERRELGIDAADVRAGAEMAGMMGARR